MDLKLKINKKGTYIRYVVFNISLVAILANIYPVATYVYHGNIHYIPGFFVNFLILSLSPRAICVWWFVGALFLISKMVSDPIPKYYKYKQYGLLLFFVICLVDAIFLTFNLVGNVNSVPENILSKEQAVGVYQSLEGSFYFYISMIVYLISLTLIYINKNSIKNFYKVYNIASLVFFVAVIIIATVFFGHQNILFLN